MDGPSERERDAETRLERRSRGPLGGLFARHSVYTQDDPFEEQRSRVREPMRRLFREYGRPHWRSLALGQAGGLFARLFEILPPLVLGVAIDAVFLGSRPFELPFVPTSLLPSEPDAQFVLSALLIAASFALGALANWVRARGLTRFAQEVQHDVRVDAYDRIQRLDMAFFDEKQTGELMSVLAGDTNNLEQFLNGGTDGVSRLIVLVGAIAAVMISLNPQLALVSLVPVPVLAVFTYRYVQVIQPRYANVRKSLADLYARLENNLTGVQVIKTSNTEPFERERVGSASRSYVDTNWRAIRLSTTFFPTLRVVAGVGFVLTFLVGGIWVFSGPPLFFSGALTVGEFVTFVLLSQQLVQPMSDFGSVIDLYQKAKASAARVFGIMDEPPKVPEKADATDLTAPEGAVAYDDVRFGYREDQRILDGVSFAVEPGETVAFVGPSGSGKSTALKLLPRMYDADAGAVRVDGQDVQDLTLSSLRGAIGYVGQEPFLFAGSVRENIAYGTPDASEEAVREAAERANAHGFITNLPEGYDTEVGQRGGKLSGGQRQRLSIARAVLRDPDILMLDEATSAVDTETELLIQRALAELTEGRTTFAIAHRLSTIKDADTILTFENGEIVERGSHDELLEADGLYAHLWRVQAGQIEDLPEDFFERALERGSRVEE